MPFLLLLIMTVACLPGEWPAAPEALGVAGSALVTWTACAVMVGLAAILASWFCRRLLRNPDERSAILRRYRSWRFYHFLTLLGTYFVSLYVLGWAQSVRSGELVGVASFPGEELLILAPFLISLIFTWAFFYSVERAASETAVRDGPFPSRWAYVGLQTQTNLILICPPLLLMIVQETLVSLVPGLLQDWVLPAVSIALIACIFLGLPWILRLMLGLRPLPAGPLRERLQAASRRLHFRSNGILLWNTRNAMANAMVTGLLPWPRYIVVTDRLLNELTPDEVEAVFGHEVGHVKHKHLLYYLGFLLLSLFALIGIWGVTGAALSADSASATTASGTATREAITALPFLAMIGAYIFLVFGFLSRRCERQADIFGCRAVSCALPECSGHSSTEVLVPRGQNVCPTGIRTFIGALEKVARLNGINREKPGPLSWWLHSTIARRVEFLEQMSANPEVEHRFQQAVRRVKWGLVLGLGALLAVAVVALTWTGIGLEKLWAN
jgi:Zn-dependent protease with chaperone function